MPEKIVTTSSEAVTSVIFGTCDENVKAIEERFGVRIANNGANRNGTGDAILVTGANAEGVRLAAETLEYLKRMTADGDTLSEGSVSYVISSVESGEAEDLGTLSDVICVTMKGKPIRPKTVGQKKYVDAIKKNTVTIGVGPAGTGKTFLAVAMAVEALRNKKVSRIILTRPAVEAGEKLGFLPGDLQSKIDPYLRPLYDSLHDMFGAENYQRHLERNTIEIAPLAYMRGRTLDDSFIILDEAQNTTAEQMKMFLTRLGNNSRIVVTGDPSQTDLPFGKKSGLAVAVRILKGIEGIAVHQFTERDVVRHPLVQKIITAYDKYERERKNESGRTFSARRFSEDRKG
ncbi:MAG: PhoH family protein [Clostridia bacterium]|nr:PhoH family protein [Clostridia bacterium]